MSAGPVVINSQTSAMYMETPSSVIGIFNLKEPLPVSWQLTEQWPGSEEGIFKNAYEFWLISMDDMKIYRPNLMQNFSLQ